MKVCSLLSEGSREIVQSPLPDQEPGHLREVLRSTSRFVVSSILLLFLQPAAVSAASLGEALNATNLVWNTHGDFPWIAQSPGRSDYLAARSGNITHNQSSALETTVTGPGTVSFWWRASTETNNDYGAILVDSHEHARISGEVPAWRQRSIDVGFGSHLITWQYSRNGTGSGGNNVVWLEDVSFAAGAQAAAIAVDPASRVFAPFASASMSVEPRGTPPLQIQWFKNGEPVESATNATLAFDAVTFLDAGTYHASVSNAFGFAVSTNAEVRVLHLVAWGAGTANSNFNPHFGQSSVPVSGVDAKSIGTGFYHSLALRPDGRVAIWGQQSQPPGDLTNAAAVSGGSTFSAALRTNGTLSYWGSISFQVGTATNLSAIAAGSSHVLGLRSNGTVMVAGSFLVQGQGIIPTNLLPVVGIAAGAHHNVVLQTNGTVRAWGGNFSGQTNVPIGLSNVVAIAAGGSNSVAIRSDGTIVVWGDNGSGQTNVPPSATNIFAASVGFGHILAHRYDGSLIAWGANQHGQAAVPDALTNVVAVSSGAFHNLAMVHSGGPALLTRTINRTVFVGEPVSFAASPFGSEPLFLQWMRNDEILPDQTNRALNISAAAAGDSGAYSIIASHGSGSVTGLVGRLTVNTLEPSFTQNPSLVHVAVGSNAVLRATVVGMPPISLQWRFNGTNIQGYTNLEITLTNVHIGQEGEYSLVASNAFGQTISANAALIVIDLPEALDAPELAWATYAEGSWIPHTGDSHDGIAAGMCIRMNPIIPSHLSTYVVGPAILKFWYTVAFSSGFTKRFDFRAYGPFGYESRSLSSMVWKEETVFLPAGTNAVEWSAGSSETGIFGLLDSVSVTPGAVPPFVTPLADQTAAAGENLVLSAPVFGTPPLTLQWRHNGTNIAGATRTSLSLTNVQAHHSGEYDLLITSPYGSTNAMATVSITPSVPQITTPVKSREMVFGGTVQFDVEARGTDPLTYQWEHAGVAISHATNASLRLSLLEASSAGTYRVVITNIFGSATSEAVLTVVPRLIVGWGTITASTPEPPFGVTNVIAISAGDATSVALRDDGTLYAWGWDAFSRLAVPSTATNVVKISMGGMHGSALHQNGTLTHWGDPFFDSSSIVPPGLVNVIETASGDAFHIVLKADGTLTVWGDGFLNPTNVPPNLSNIVAIAAGNYHGVALTREGGVVSWGYNSRGQTNVPPGLSNIVSVAAGGDFSMALDSSGRVSAWGSGGSLVTTIPISATNVVAIAAGGSHALALRSDRTLVTWGNGSDARDKMPPWLTNVVAIDGGRTHSLALLNDGSPHIVRHPWTQTVFTGDTVRFDVAALGNEILSYQWKHNGTNVPGATGATLLLTNAPLMAAGIYHCVVTNPAGVAASHPASLAVLRSTPQVTAAGSGFEAPGTFRMRILGLSGHGEVLVYASTNLLQWQPVHTNAAAVGTILYFDAVGTNAMQRFFRVEER
ncbi:MAG TPA: immunoglobulin domain-containing protein [Verrucomicrobiae bacterium]|nr:immunoglobulin domain-containing protein [Verrucomicrobiae bacterium]